MRWLFRFLALLMLMGASPVWAQTAIGYESTLGSQGVTPVSPTTPLPVTSSVSGSVTNPTSTLTLPSTTTAYTVGQLMCTSATVATCNTALTSQFFSIANTAGAVSIPRLRLTTNDATSTAWGTQTIQIDLWSAAPTFATTGDRGSFTTDFLTGSAGHLAAFTCVMSAELADGAYSECYPNVGNAALIKLASGTSIFWTAQAVTGSGTTGASKVFTLTAELQN